MVVRANPAYKARMKRIGSSCQKNPARSDTKVFALAGFFFPAVRSGFIQRAYIAVVPLTVAVFNMRNSYLLRKILSYRSGAGTQVFLQGSCSHNRLRYDDLPDRYNLAADCFQWPS